MQDKTLTCRDCGNEFTFTVGEQSFYAQKGFTNEPVRCPDCRSARKASRGEGGSYGGGNRDREMYPAVCAECGKETQVPFLPRTDKPVYCSDCFANRRSSDNGYERGSGGNGRDQRW